MTRQKLTDELLSERAVAMVTPSESRRIDFLAETMREKAGGEFTRSDAIRLLLHRSLDDLKIRDPDKPT